MMFASYLRNGSLVTVDVQVSDRERRTLLYYITIVAGVVCKYERAPCRVLLSCLLHEWHTLYYKCTSVRSSISTLCLVCSLVLTSAESLVVRKLIGSLICYHYTTIYYSAVASNLLRLSISRAILSDQPELVL